MGLADWLYNAATGNLSASQLEAIKKESDAGIEKASRGADPAVIRERQAAARAEIDGYVRSVDAHPQDSGLRLPGLGVVGSADFLKKLGGIVNGAIAVGLVAGTLWLAFKLDLFRRRG